MTASIRNSRSSLMVLMNGLKWFREATHETPEYRVWMLETLVDSFEKCLASLAAQVRFYQSAKGTGRAFLVERADGGHDVISGQLVETLVLHVPGSETDAVVHGKPEALAAIRAALEQRGETVSGPASIHDLARHLADTAAPPMATEEGKPNGNP